MPRRRTEPVRSISIFLIKSGFERPEKIFKADPSALAVGQASHIPGSPRLYVVRHHPKVPGWVKLIHEFPNSADIPKSTAAGAILTLETSGRTFVVALGTGRHLLSPTAFEIDFGLRVALNAVDEKRLRSMDIKTFEEQTLHSRRQASRGSSLDVFGLDVARDILGSVTGEPNDPSLARRLSGRDSLVVTAPLSLATLANKCDQLLKLYSDRAYKRKFPWIENVKPIRDMALIGTLDNKLVAALQQKDLSKLYLAPPEIINWHNIAGFRYPGERKPTPSHSDLDASAFVAQLEKVGELKTLTATRLKSLRVRAIPHDEEAYAETWTAYSCIAFEAERSGRMYVLTTGHWFEINKNFAGEIVERIDALEEADVALPAAHSGEAEADYNQRAANENKELVVLDRVLVRVAGAASAIEFCDLMSTKGHLIHAKRRSASATLSHLFSQGYVSAESLLRDEKLREEVVAKLSGKPAFSRQVEPAEERPNPAKFEVVFAILRGSPAGRISEVLPFFSQLNLWRVSQHLASYGFRVTWKVT